MMNTVNNPGEEGIRAARRDAQEWRYSDNNTFRTLPPTKEVHDGKPVLVTVCEEYVDGRWEGFVSVAPLPTEAEKAAARAYRRGQIGR
jgi:hypothetical protein